MRGGLVNDTFPSTDDIDEADPWAEWPESDLEIDDDAFAEAIAQGRTLDDTA
jgi:hypothetical protein